MTKKSNKRALEDISNTASSRSSNHTEIVKKKKRTQKNKNIEDEDDNEIEVGEEEASSAAEGKEPKEPKETKEEIKENNDNLTQQSQQMELISQLSSSTTTTVSTTTTTIETTSLSQNVSFSQKNDSIVTNDNDGLVLDERHYMNRSIVDIDAITSANNPSISSINFSLLREAYRSTEQLFRVNHQYMNQQTFISRNSRAVLVDWLIHQHNIFGMYPQTIFLTVQLIDRFLSRKRISLNRLQLVGVAAFFIAIKSERSQRQLSSRELAYITNDTYTFQQIIAMEANILTTLNANTYAPTIYTFLSGYLPASRTPPTVHHVAYYLAERSLQEYCTLKYPPSLIAAKAIHVARKTFDYFPWSPTLAHYTRYDEPDFIEIGNDMRHYLATATQLISVNNKYADVASMQFIV